MSAAPPVQPDRPATALDAFQRLELAVRRRVEGRLHGDHAGLLPGHGSELGEARPYEAGDDVRRIDWAVSARHDRPFVRDTIADHELTGVVALDLSASLEFGTARTTKRRVALDACGALGFVVAHGANRFGVLALHPDLGAGYEWLPPASGRLAVHAALRRIDRLPRAAGPVDLAAGIATAHRLARRAGFVAVVSDFLDRGEWDRSLRSLAARHEVLAVEVLDPRELALPDVGYLTVADIETGRRRVVDTADARVRTRYAAAAARQRRHIARRIRRAGADHVVLRTDRDWLADLVRHVEVRRRSRHQHRAVAGR